MNPPEQDGVSRSKSKANAQDLLEKEPAQKATSSHARIQNKNKKNQTLNKSPRVSSFADFVSHPALSVFQCNVTIVPLAPRYRGYLRHVNFVLASVFSEAF